MGWASGSGVMNEIIDTMQDEIDDVDQRRRVYKGIIEAMEGNDWDTQDECIGQDPAFDAALQELHPDWNV